jgi:hypothetical protein
VIRLYIFFSKLEKHLQHTFSEELQQWSFPTETTINTLRWRSPNYVRKCYQSEAEHSTHGGAMEVDGFNDNKGVEVMTWREAVKEARAISGEGEISSMA